MTAADVTDLQFATLGFTSVANANDGVNISFTDFGVATANQNLNAGNTGGSPFTLQLSTLANFSTTADSLFLEPDGNQSNNRWAINGISAMYSIPEPSSAFLLGGSALLLLRRRRF